MLEKIKVGTSALSNQVLLYRMGKDPVAALETKDVTKEAVKAVMEHLIAKPGHAAAIQATHTKYGCAKFTLTIKIEPIPDLGTIIRGTHRHQDLMPAMWKELARLNVEKAIESITEYFGDEDAEIHSLIRAAADDKWPKESDPVWDRSEVAEYIGGVLIHELDEIGQAHNFYFGAHEGDGSDYGFWHNPAADEQS